MAAINTPTDTDNPRGGVNIHFNLSADADLQQSPTWQVGGRSLTFVYLPAGQSLPLPDGEVFAKVIFGELSNLERTCLAAPFSVRSTRVTQNEVQAGGASGEGALFALVVLSNDAPARIEDMSQLTFQGTHAECLTWQSFEQRFAGITDYFDGMDCHMANGFHLLDANGREVVYVNPWTCGKGVDLSTHNHAHTPSEMSPAFAEVHWVLAAATDSSGMYRTSEPGADERERFAMGLGDEHGPFYDRDPKGRPLLRDNGAVQYPWHGWQGGLDGLEGQSYDFVAAFEIAPDLITP